MTEGEPRMTDEEPSMRFTSTSGLSDADTYHGEPDPAVAQSFADVAATEIGGKDGVLHGEVEGNTVRAQWRVNKATSRDWIGLFVHERRYDNHYFASCYTDGKLSGEYVFRGLARGYYDLRFFQNGSGQRAEGVNMSVFCIGTPVKVTATLVNHRTIAVSWPPEFTDSANLVALFSASEHDNREGKALALKYMRDADTAAAPTPRLTLPAPRKPGDYHVRFFLNDSMGVDGTNVFSGMTVVTIKKEDSMEAEFDFRTMKFTVKWHAFSVDPHNWQWIGLYDDSGDQAKRITYEYVSKHRYTSPERDEGEIEFTEVPDVLRQWAVSRVMPKEITKWELRFFNGQFANSLVHKCPCFH